MPYELLAGSQLLFGVLGLLAYVGAAALIWWRRRGGALATFVIAALLLRSPGFVAGLDVLPERVPLWAGPTIAVRCLDAVTALLFLFVFPSGRFVPRATAAIAAAWAAWVFGTLATPDVNPVLHLEREWVRVLVASLALAGLGAQVYRYRVVATERERLQMRWVLYGAAVYVVAFAAHQLVPVVAPVVTEPGVARFWYRFAGDAAIDVAATVLPATIAIAILRSRLFEIDLIINRTIVYVAVTMILSGVFAGASTAAQYVLGELTGHGSDALSIVIAMGVAVAFAPLKAWVQRVVDALLRGAPS